MKLEVKVKTGLEDRALSYLNASQILHEVALDYTNLSLLTLHSYENTLLFTYPGIGRRIKKEKKQKQIFFFFIMKNSPNIDI